MMDELVDNMGAGTSTRDVCVSKPEGVLHLKHTNAQFLMASILY